MAQNSFEAPQDPVELANLRVQQTSAIVDDFEITPEDERILAELDFAADSLGFIGRPYYLSAARGFVLPKEFDPSEPVTYHSIFDVMAEGAFATYSKLRIGKLVGVGTVRAFCLTFDEALILPYFAQLEPDEMLLVPVLAVGTILPTGK
jgi:hypothetical protein